MLTAMRSRLVVSDNCQRAVRPLGPRVDPFHITLLAGTAAVLVLPVLLATMGARVAVRLVVLMLVPLVTVIGYETLGHRHVVIAVQRTLADQRGIR
jgi:hypothetical protein